MAGAAKIEPIAKKLRPLPSIANADTFVQELNVLQLEGLLFSASTRVAIIAVAAGVAANVRDRWACRASPLDWPNWWAARLPAAPCRDHPHRHRSIAIEPRAGGRSRPQHQLRTHAPQQNYKCYSITSSARANSIGGTVSPSAFADLRLMTKSNLVGCSTGSSLAFTPFKMRVT